MGGKQGKPLLQLHGKGSRNSQDYIYDVPRAPYSREPLEIPRPRNGSVPSAMTDPSMSLSAAFAATRAALSGSSVTTPHMTPRTSGWSTPQQTPRSTPRPSLSTDYLVSAPLAVAEAYSTRTNSIDTLDDDDDYYGMPLSTSAPSTPTLENRRHPPPKPPRIKSYLEGGRESSVSPTPSLASSVSTTVEAPTSSLADITTTLERSVADSPDGSLLVSRHSTSYFNDKIYSVLLQTRDCLYYEINPMNIVGYLFRRGVINKMTEQEVLKCSSRRAMCDLLLDIITSKGQREFNIFCDALRRVERQYYLADLLIVLDCLIDWLTNPKSSTSDTLRAPNGTFNTKLNTSTNNLNGHSGSECAACKFQSNNECEFLSQDSSSFDIEILYFDKELRMLQTMKDVAAIKEKIHGIAINDSFLVKMDLENAARYVPVISLSLYNECLHGENVEMLAKLLEYHVCIRELSLTKNHLDMQAWKRLAQAIKQNKSLITLDIRLNVIDEESAHHLAEGLGTNTGLRTLSMPSTDLTGPSLGTILDCLARHSSLSDLDIGFNDLQDEGCKSLAGFLLTSANMKRLRMRDSGITDFGVRKVFKAMKRNSRLSVLDLSSNILNKDATSAMAEMLLHNRTLRELNLEKCGITKEGCRALARALRTNTVLRSLNLSMNPLKDAGVSDLADGLKYNRVIETLCLNMCNIGNSGFICILEAVKHNSNLTSLKLCYNMIGQNVTDEIGSVSDLTESTALESSSPDVSVFEETVSSDDMNPLLPASSSSPSVHDKSLTLTSNLSLSVTSERSMTLTSQTSSMFSCYTNPLMASLSVDDLYDKLAEILQVNKNLRVLLWGNKLEDSHALPHGHLSTSLDTSIQDLSFDVSTIPRTQEKLIIKS